MTSEPMRDPFIDPLLTPANSALVVIDYQPSQIHAVTSMDTELLIRNIVTVARIAKTYRLPIVLSTVNVAANGQPPTIPELKDVLSDDVEIDRTQINAWEDVEFRQAVDATGRNKLIMTALWTEVCLAFPCLDALRDGYEVYPVVDAVGGLLSRRIEPVLSAWSKLERSRSAGCPWPASFSGTGLGWRPSPTSWTSSSTPVCLPGCDSHPHARL